MQVELSLNRFLPLNFKKLRFLDLFVVMLISITLLIINGQASHENQTREGRALYLLVERVGDEVAAVTSTMAKTFAIKEELNPATYDPFTVVSSLLPTLSKSQINNKQVQCLAENIYYEARGEGPRGWLAVAEVTMNRVRKSGFPDTICGVVYQRTATESSTICQFSWACDSRGKPEGLPWDRAQKLAAAYYFNPEQFPVVSNGATHFHVIGLNPGWKLAVAARIEDHIFYKKNGE